MSSGAENPADDRLKSDLYRPDSPEEHKKPQSGSGTQEKPQKGSMKRVHYRENPDTDPAGDPESSSPLLSRVSEVHFKPKTRKFSASSASFADEKPERRESVVLSLFKQEMHPPPDRFWSRIARKLDRWLYGQDFSGKPKNDDSSSLPNCI